MGLATGSSPIGTYEHLVKMYENGDLDFSQVTTVNLDEYKGLSGSDMQSYRYFMNTHLFHKININYSNTYVPDGTEQDAEKACSAYNELLHKVGPADIQILGLGHDGHIGFNEPSDHFEDETHWCRSDRNYDSGKQSASSKAKQTFHVRLILWESVRSCDAKRFWSLSVEVTKHRFLKRSFRDL